jgi:hypothetical protein
MCVVLLLLYWRLLCNWSYKYNIITCNNVPYSYFLHLALLHIVFIDLPNFKCTSINCIINCNIVPYSYFPHVLSLHILYIQLQTVKCINSIINCNIVPYSYFPLVLSLHILYTDIQTYIFEKCLSQNAYFLPWTIHIIRSYEVSCLTNVLFVKYSFDIMYYV